MKPKGRGWGQDFGTQPQDGINPYFLDSIKQVDHTCFPGVVLDKNLAWKKHTQVVET